MLAKGCGDVRRPLLPSPCLPPYPPLSLSLALSHSFSHSFSHSLDNVYHTGDGCASSPSSFGISELIDPMRGHAANAWGSANKAHGRPCPQQAALRGGRNTLKHADQTRRFNTTLARPEQG